MGCADECRRSRTQSGKRCWRQNFFEAEAVPNNEERSQRASSTNGFEGRADISHVDQEELFSRASAAAAVQTYTAILSDRRISVVLLRLVMQDVFLKLSFGVS